MGAQVAGELRGARKGTLAEGAGGPDNRLVGRSAANAADTADANAADTAAANTADTAAANIASEGSDLEGRSLGHLQEEMQFRWLKRQRNAEVLPGYQRTFDILTF